MAISESKHPLHRLSYKDALTDTSRWEQFPAAEGDIFVVTPAKNGTTWMQTIVTFLVFGSSDLDFVPAERSPWFDVIFNSVEETLETLSQDNKRNIIKTHTPLDGVPFYEGASYIGVYRDPRDAFFSMRNHADNMVMDLRERDAEGNPIELSVEESFRKFIEAEYLSGDLGKGLASRVHHLRCFWELKNRPNIHLFHYSDLLRDLKGQMLRVAAAINVDIEESSLEQLVEAATFTSMRAKSEKFVPGGKKGFWHDPKEFLKKGGNGQWQGIISEDLLEQFDARLKDLAGDEMANWLVNGNRTD